MSFSSTFSKFLVKLKKQRNQEHWIVPKPRAYETFLLAESFSLAASLESLGCESIFVFAVRHVCEVYLQIFETFVGVTGTLFHGSAYANSEERF